MRQEQDLKMAKQYLKVNNFTEEKGFAIDTQAMNPEEHDEIFMQGKTLQEAIRDYVRRFTWWSYEPSDGEQIFEDIWDAVDYVESTSDISFEQFKEGVK